MGLAFMIIDVQKAYVKENGYRDMIDEAAMYINEVARYFREAKFPVIHIQHKEPDFDETKEGFQVSEKIDQAETDLYVHKEFGNAFWKTDLDNILKKLGVDFLVCAGLSAAYCVTATYNGAQERGYGVSLLQHGLLGRTYDEVKHVHRERNLISYSAVGYMIRHMK